MRLLLVVACSLVACSVAAAPASYRFHAVADLDRDAHTGCSLDGFADSPAGNELRFSVRTDRAQISETLVEICQEGSWQVAERDTSPRPIAVAMGPAGSDLIEWSVSRRWFAAYARLPLRFYSQRLDTPALDALADGTQWLTLDLALIDSSLAIPALGLSGLLLLSALLLWLGRRSSGRLPTLLAMALAATQPSVAADSRLFARIGADDSGNDVLDAGADLMHAEAVAEAEHVVLRIAVNNIEEDGLANPARVLFIGNSLTYSNDLPVMLQALALQAGKQLTADAITIPGGALEDHFRARTAHAALTDGHYQIVILQQGPSSLPESQANLREWTLRFNARIRAGGARPALYMVWPDATRIAFFDAVRESYSNAAADVDGMFIPAGEAWRAAWRSDADLPLYDSDLFHPSALGSYAAALSIFAELYRQSPLGLPARLTLGDGATVVFPEDQVHVVQAAAWSAHLQFGRPGQ